MAVDWGAWEYASGNGMRVGVEATVEAISHSESVATFTVKYWTENQYSMDDTQTLNFGGSIGGSLTFTNNDGGSPVLRATKTYDYTYPSSSYGSSPGTRTFSATLSGAYNGITPTGSDTISIPARPYGAPDPTTSATASRVSDDTTKITWVNHATAGEPYTGVTVERFIYGYGSYAGYGWGVLANASASATSYSHTTVLPNRKWYYRVNSKNTIGESAFDYTNLLWTTPATPTACARSGTTDQVISWTNNVYYSEHQVEIWHAANGVWSLLTTVAGGVPGSAGSYTHNASSPGGAPSAAVKHKYKVRTKTTSGTLLYSSYSGETTETSGTTSTPSAPTNLQPTGSLVVDPTGPIVFTWQHNPTDGSAQTKYQVQHRVVGAGSWTTTAEITSAGSTFTLPSASYVYSQTVEWQVKTWGSSATGSAWSASAIFVTQDAVPKKYPLFLDLTSGRMEADSNVVLATEQLRRVGSSTRTSSTSNTTAAYNVMTFPIPVELAKTGKKFRVTANGNFVGDAVGAATILSIKVGILASTGGTEIAQGQVDHRIANRAVSISAIGEWTYNLTEDIATCNIVVVGDPQTGGSYAQGTTARPWWLIVDEIVAGPSTAGGIGGGGVAGEMTGYTVTLGAITAAVYHSVTHGLGTLDVITTFRETSTGYTLDLNWSVVDSNTIEFLSDVAYGAGAVRAMVLGVL